MNIVIGSRRFIGMLVIILLSTSSMMGQTPHDLVSGNLIQFNDNGVWCWYQDERAVIDRSGGKLILGSDASGSGVGGSARSGDVDAVTFDLLTGLSLRTTLREGDPSVFYADDHNAPAFLIRPDGKYLGFYAAHFGDTSSHYRVFNAGSWSSERVFNWKQRRPGGANFQTTYSNLFYLSAEGRTYNFVRGNNKSPNFMYSTDMGETWAYGGQLTASGDVGYNNGYYKYWSNGVDRIDFIFTEYHPRDFPTSIYHGYIMEGKSYASDGTVADDNIFDTLNVPTFARFTKVFADSTIVQGVAMRRCWNVDVQRYDDGSIAAIITARANNNQGGSSTSINPDHRFLYCRFDGSHWTTTYLCKAGLKLYSSEQDYTGLGVLCPNDPNTIFLSVTNDPRDDSNLGVHEIFKGVTSDHGTTWAWTPITRNSVRDNLRPIVPLWDDNGRALLWVRGVYSSAQNTNVAIVGTLERRSEIGGPMIYVDATTANTVLATGQPLVTTGPDSSAGPADNQWHQRLGIGNGGSIFASAEAGGENAPSLRTEVTVPAAGTYDVWVNFWALPATSADWRIRAGLSADRMQLFRQMACKEVEGGDHAVPIVLTGGGNTFLYQAYCGRVEVTTDRVIDVYVDDDATRTGTTGTLVGDVARTWYDGVSYSSINRTVDVSYTRKLPTEYALSQNYPNPFNPSTEMKFRLPLASTVSLVIFDVLGREVAVLAQGTFGAGTYIVRWNAASAATGVYYARFNVREQAGTQRYTRVNRLLLIK